MRLELSSFVVRQLAQQRTALRLYYGAALARARWLLVLTGNRCSGLERSTQAQPVTFGEFHFEELYLEAAWPLAKVAP